MPNVRSRQHHDADTYTRYDIVDVHGAGALHVGDGFCIRCDNNWQKDPTTNSFPDATTAVLQDIGIKYDLARPANVPFGKMECGGCSSGHTDEVIPPPKKVHLSGAVVIEANAPLRIRATLDLRIDAPGANTELPSPETLLRLNLTDE